MWVHVALLNLYIQGAGEVMSIPTSRSSVCMGCSILKTPLRCDSRSPYFAHLTRTPLFVPVRVSIMFEKGATQGECSEMTEGQDSLSVPYGSYHQLYRIDGKLVAVGVVDILPKCLVSLVVLYVKTGDRSTQCLKSKVSLSACFGPVSLRKIVVYFICEDNIIKVNRERSQRSSSRIPNKWCSYNTS